MRRFWTKQPLLRAALALLSWAWRERRLRTFVGRPCKRMRKVLFVRYLITSSHMDTWLAARRQPSQNSHTCARNPAALAAERILNRRHIHLRCCTAWTDGE